MADKLFNFGNRALRWLFYIFFLLTLYFAITSANLILGDNRITGAGTTLYTAWFIIITLTIIVGIWAYRRWYQWFYWAFIDHKLMAASVILGLAVIVQVIFVTCMHPAIGWDVDAIHQALLHPKNAENIGYFSRYANNLSLLLMQRGLSQLFGTTSWLFFDIVTTVLVDLSALFNILTVRVIDRSKTATAMYIHAIWLALFPMIIVPYTDTWVLPWVSGYLLCYSLLIYRQWSWPVKGGLAVTLGLCAAGAYFMKPSAIVAIIAIVIVETLFFFNPLISGDKGWWTVLLAVVAGLAMAGGYAAGNHVMTHQNFITIRSNRGVPPIHFMSMGVSGDGGYNAKDDLKMATLPNKKARADYSKKMLIKRLRRLGVGGYLAFLYKKHANDTADGSFAWIKEGHFIKAATKTSHRGFAGKLRNFFYLYGTNLGDFRYIAQVWWIIWLLIIALGGRMRDKFTQCLRLTIIGGCLFLLLFEGGRSRYLIQFLPAYLLLASLVFRDSLALFQRLFSWVNRPVS